MAIIRGTAGKDTLIGTNVNDFIYAGAGDDVIDGGAGNDKLAGEDGNDTFLGGAGADTMSGGAGIDTVDYSNSQAVTVSLRAGTGSGGDAEGDTLGGIENLIGSNKFNGHDTLTGDGGSNTIDGRAGNDTIFGCEGNDVLIGGFGNDTMSGGADADTFVFNVGDNPNDPRIPAWGQDVITDFQVGVDVLEFRGFNVNSTADLSFSQVGNDTVVSLASSSSFSYSIALQNVSLEQLMAHQAHDLLFV
jgi:Ca2+-binding RTX toxin-like protein